LVPQVVSVANMAEISVLVRRWQAGDERAAEAIYNQYRDTVFELAYALLSDRADAEEVAQDALTYALTHIERYDPGRARFRTWLHTITVSRCRNKRRRHILPSVSLVAWLKGGGDVRDTAPGPEHRAVQQAACDEVREAIESLSRPLREAILLRYWADYTYQEIGDMLGCSMRTAQSRVRMAHTQLGKSLAQNDLGFLEESAK
jgi:RNA polymerase sigma-70 factor (ECF subfamily)